MHEQPLPDAIKQALMHGDLSGLTPEQQLLLYHQTCASLGLNPLTNPFHYLWLKGEGDKKRLVLYATKGCADQLRSIHNITESIVSRVIEDGLCIVTARASDASGRYDEDFGIVPIAKEVGDWKTSPSGKRYFQGDGIYTMFEGESRANAIKKAVTQAKRRSTLSFCGLGMLDESEIEGIPGAMTQESPTALGHPIAQQPALPASAATQTFMSSPEPEKAPVVVGPVVTEGNTASAEGKGTESKLTALDIAQLLDFLKARYQNDLLVDEAVRRIVQIPAGQSWNAVRLRHTMTRAQYVQLQKEAEAYARASMQQDDQDDVSLTAGPDASESSQNDAEDITDTPEDTDNVDSTTGQAEPFADDRTSVVIYATSEERQRVMAYAEAHGLATVLDDTLKHYPQGITPQRLAEVEATLKARVSRAATTV